ncbi:uncharacterized protein ACOB8E_021065 [Sarcophilus harrisii]
MWPMRTTVLGQVPASTLGAGSSGGRLWEPCAEEGRSWDRVRALRGMEKVGARGSARGSRSHRKTSEIWRGPSTPVPLDLVPRSSSPRLPDILWKQLGLWLDAAAAVNSASRQAPVLGEKKMQHF